MPCATGHWRDLRCTEAGARAYFDGVRGVHIARGSLSTPAQPALAAITSALNEAGKGAVYVSESDSTPTALAAQGTDLSAKGVMKIFKSAIEAELGGSLQNYTAKTESVREFWSDVTTDPGPDVLSSGTYAKDWKKLRLAFDQNVKNPILVRIGPKADDGSMDDDAGMYVYCLVGRGPQGYLAGVLFASVET